MFLVISEITKSDRTQQSFVLTETDGAQPTTILTRFLIQLLANEILEK